MASHLTVDHRELWLGRAVRQMRSYVKLHGLTLPPSIVIEVGETSISDGERVLGECYSSFFEPLHVPRIVISNELVDPLRILDVVIHELIHAADDGFSQHGEWFNGWAQALGLVGSPGTVAGAALRKKLIPMARMLGPYPGPGIALVLDLEGRLVA
jgi:hypothetical protein